jgi:radical SAM-linked protein
MVALPPTPAPPPGGTPPRLRAALEFDVGGALRYLSHQDELRMLGRALVRARWPLRYSQGFNPRPRMTLPFPRNVGTAADRQLALVDLTTAADGDALFARLARQLPAAAPLRSVQAPGPRGTPLPTRVVYEVELDAADATGLAARIAALLACPAIPVARDCGPHKAPRALDIRPHIENVLLADGRLRLELRFAEGRTARPAEITTALGLAAERCVHRIRRVHVAWHIELGGPHDRPGAHERIDLGNEEDHDSQEDR